MLGGLTLLGGERPDRVHVHQAVGHMAGHPGDGLLTLPHENLAAADEGGHTHRRQRDHRQQADDEQRFVAPEHHRPEGQRHEAAHDGEGQGVDELLEAGGEAQDPLGERSREVVVEERGVLGVQLIHARDVQVLDGECRQAVQEVQTDAPERLGEEKYGGEPQDIGEHRSDRGVLVAGDTPDEFRDDERRRVVDSDVAERRQQHRGQRHPLSAGQLPSVVTKCEEHGAPARRFVRFRRSHINPVWSCGCGRRCVPQRPRGVSVRCALAGAVLRRTARGGASV